MNMGHPDLDYMIAVERRKDEMAQAAQYRLVKEAKMAARMAAGPQPFWPIRLVDGLLLVAARILSHLGARMLNWGCRLQTRYEVVAGVVAENRPSPCA